MPMVASPHYDPSDWPAWAQQALVHGSKQATTPEPKNTIKTNLSPAVAELSQTMGSLAISASTTGSIG
jgi:hypothetical protein